MSGPTTLLAAGLAGYLATSGIGVWDPAGIYLPTDVGIYDTVLPPDVDQLITLTCYPVTADAFLSDSVIGVQVRTRKPGPDPRPVRDLDDQIFDAFQGLANTDLPSGVRLVLMEFQSTTPMGVENQRWEWSSNYHATVWRPSTHRQ